MIDAFTAAVESYREAQARFDAALGAITDPWPDFGCYLTDPKTGEVIYDGGVHRAPQRAVDYCEHREATVPALAVEMQERATRLSRERAESRKERKQRPTVGDKIAACWARRKAAARQREEERDMPRGKQGPTDEQLLEVARTFSVSFTTDELLERLTKVHGKAAPGYETLHKRLAGMRKHGTLTGGRGYGKGAPTVWATTGRDTKGRPAPGPLVSADAKKAARSLDAEATLRGEGPHHAEFAAPGLRVLELFDGRLLRVTLGGGDVLIGTLADFNAAVTRRVAEALRTTADEYAARVSGGAA